MRDEAVASIGRIGRFRPIRSQPPLANFAQIGQISSIQNYESEEFLNCFTEAIIMRLQSKEAMHRHPGCKEQVESSRSGEEELPLRGVNS